MTASENSHWRRVLNGPLYTVQFASDLDDTAFLNDAVGRLRARPLFGEVPAAIAAALRTALHSGQQLTGAIPQPHPEAAIRTFHSRLTAHLEASSET